MKQVKENLVKIIKWAQHPLSWRMAWDRDLEKGVWWVMGHSSHGLMTHRRKNGVLEFFFSAKCAQPPQLTIRNYITFFHRKN